LRNLCGSNASKIIFKRCYIVISCLKFYFIFTIAATIGHPFGYSRPTHGATHMNTNTPGACEQRGLKTYQVLDAMLDGFQNLPALTAKTGLSYRTINALVYALEKQGRVVAQNYDARRCNQVFDVIQYEAAPTAPKNKRRIDAKHPASLHASLKIQSSFNLLQQAFFFPKSPAAATAWA
jgi:hypothetical protein